MSQEITNPKPSLIVKVCFWILLGLASTAFAEVVSGSTTYPFFDAWGIIVVTPLYTLHILFFTTLLVRYRRFTWNGLLFAGALFGLYEAVITKVLWKPDWLPDVGQFAEVAWLHVALLVLWWHPIFAFILPLMFAEILMTKSRYTFECLPGLWQRILIPYPRLWIVVLFIVCGLHASGNAPTADDALVSPLLNTLIVGGLCLLWQSFGPGQRYTLEVLLPGANGFRILTGALVVFYIVTGAVILPEKFPGPVGFIAITACYALFIYAFVRIPQSDLVLTDRSDSSLSHFKLMIDAGIASGGAAGLAKAYLGDAAFIFILISWICACTVGVFVYTHALWTTLRR